jgi:hypothetical protein
MSKNQKKIIKGKEILFNIYKTVDAMMQFNKDSVAT